MLAQWNGYLLSYNTSDVTITLIDPDSLRILHREAVSASTFYSLNLLKNEFYLSITD
jgi:hypothetical protein